MENQIVMGSIANIARQSGKSIAETFLNADVVIIVDVSGSMNTHDSRGGKTRYEVACEELTSLQNSMPGKIAVIGFSNEVVFYPSGIVAYSGGGTEMDKALKFAKIADLPGMQFILISDGYPDNEQATLAVAKTYKNKISTIYVGPEFDQSAKEFLERLSKLTGGQSITNKQCLGLKDSVETLLLKG